MGRIWMPGGGGGKGAKLEAVTAGAYDVREGAVIVDKNGNPVTGLVPTRNKWTANLPINGQVTIPWGIHDGNGLVTQNIPTQAAMTLNPGTTQKTAYVYQKYMLGNITVPAINIPAAYIKKGQRITFPDGSSVVGTFEGWIKSGKNYLLSGRNFNGTQSSSSNIEYGEGFVGSNGNSYVIFNKIYDLRRYSKVRFYAAYNAGNGDGRHYVKISARHPASGTWLTMFTIDTPSSSNVGAWLESAINVFFTDTCQLRLDFYNCLLNDVHLE